ncbi:MAG: DUF2197 domain-containing protein [Bacillota bacterium]
MQIKCSLCGAVQEITKIHKDYQRLAKDPQGVFICHTCENKVRFQAAELQKPGKPI